MRTLRCLLAVAVLLAPLGAESPPQLSLETGAHTAIAKWVGFTPDGRKLLSAGDDKALRIWDVSSPEQPRLERALRFEIGPGSEGMIYAVAIAPVPLLGVTHLVALGGYGPADAGNPVTLVDLDTGRVVQVVDAAENVVSSLAFSPAGDWLAAASADGTVRLWAITPQTTELDEPVVLKAHRGWAYSLAFVPPPAPGRPLRLATGGQDLSVALWEARDGAWPLVARLRGHFADVVQVAASRDGRYVASASYDHNVRLWDAQAAKEVRILGHHQDGVLALAFSPDGRSVVSGGGDPGTDYTCRVWNVPDGGEARRFTGHDGVVFYTAYSPEGTLVASSGGLNHDLWLWDPRTAQPRGHLVGKGRAVTAVAFSPDGRRIAFGHRPDSRPLAADAPLEATFDLATMQPGPAPQPGEPWQRGRLTEAGWSAEPLALSQLTVLKDGQKVGAVGDQQRDNLVRSYAFLPGGQRLVVGSNFDLTLFDPRAGGDGRELVGHTGFVWSVAVSPDGRFVASGAGDQTVRWWNLATGELLLSIFVGSDGEWVAWTPAGYYATSPNGDRVIGWHLNQGLDQPARYVSGWQLRKRFYRPDILLRLAETGSVEPAVKLADAALKQPADSSLTVPQLAAAAPPVVTIVEPTEGQAVAGSTLTVRAKVVDPNGRPVKGLTVLVNGRDLDTRGLRPKLLGPDGVLSREVSLVPGENLLTVRATNDQQVESQPVTVRVRYQPPPSGELLKPALYALCVGVSTYASPDYALRYAAKDARDLGRRLEGQQGRLFRQVTTKVLTDAEATQGALLDALEWLGRQATQRDYVVVFLAGHGLPDNRGEYYFLPFDGDPDRLLRTGLKWHDLRTALGAIPGRVLLALDTCHSGGQPGTRGLRPKLEYSDALRQAGDEAGLIVLASCMPQELSVEDAAWGNGAFTKALLEGLGGQADLNRDATVTVSELDAWIAERVKALTDGRQHPTSQRPSGVPSDLPLALLK